MNKFKKIIALAMLPMLLLCGGCNLFDNDEEQLTQDEMFQKYITAVNQSKIATVYTATSLTEFIYNKDVERELNLTITTDGENFYSIEEDDDEVSSKAVIKNENNQYIEYVNEDGVKTTRFTTVDDFEKEFSLVQEGMFSTDSIEEIKKSADEDLKNMLSLENEDYIKKDTAQLQIKLQDNLYVLTVTAGAIVEMGEEDSKIKAKILYIYKIYYKNKIEKFETKFDVIELNEDETVKENGQESSIVSSSNIKYEYDSSKAITDFSSYPSIR